jgi:hypothetical protein
MQAVKPDPICAVCQESLFDAQGELIVEHSTVGISGKKELKRHDPLHLSCILAIFFTHAYCPICRYRFAIPYDARDLCVVKFTKEKTWSFERYFSQKEFLEWKAEHYDIEENKMRKMIENSSNKMEASLDQLLMNAVWNGHKSIVVELVGLHKNTAIYIKRALELAFRLNHIEIFNLLTPSCFHRDLDSVYLAEDVQEDLLRCATRSSNGDAVGALYDHNSFSGVSADIIYETLMKFWVSSEQWDAGKLKIVRICADSLLREGGSVEERCENRKLLYLLLEQAYKEKNYRPIETINIAVKKMEWKMWQFVIEVLDYPESGPVLKGIFSGREGFVPWQSKSNGLVGEAMQKVVKSKNEEIFFTILRWHEYEDDGEIAEIWSKLSENCETSTGFTVKEIEDLLRERYKSRKVKEVKNAAQNQGVSTAGTIHLECPKASLSVGGTVQIQQRSSQPVPLRSQREDPLFLLYSRPPTRWQRFWEGFRDCLARWSGKFFSCFNAMGSRISHFFNL